MRKQIRSVVLLMALMEAVRVGPLKLVYAGREGFPAPGEDDFGIAYTVGYILSWLYVCVFMVLFLPLLTWILPRTTSDEDHPSLLAKFNEVLTRMNLILLPVAIGISLVSYVYYLVQTLIYVDARPVGSRKFPKNSRKNWVARSFMLSHIALSLLFGRYAFAILAKMDLAHVKPIEYAIIVVPFQINIGVLLGSFAQHKMEKSIARKEALKLQNARAELEGAVDEKAALLEEA